MRLFLILTFIVLSGCSTAVPVTINFPSVPEELNVQCPQLKKIPDNAKLSDISKTVAENYKQYKECSTNNSGLLEWYNKQRQIFNEVK